MPEFVVALLLAGCLPETVPRNCDSRIAYYPDADGDGLGERTAVYIGCEPPAGWVPILEQAPPEDSGGTGETGTTTSGDTATTTPTVPTDTAPPTVPTNTTAETGRPTDTADPSTADTAAPTAETGTPVDTSETADTGP